MFKFTRTGINIIKILAITIIVCLIQIFIYQYTRNIETEINAEIMQKEEDMPVEQEQTDEKNDIWQIKIEKISLLANISEGTTKDILNKNVGHFEETKKEEGNIGLAAHNRGYEVNYFEQLKLLQKGDEIQYQHNQYSNTYEVTKNIIIKDTDWEYLEDTEENMLTLITCVENEPNYRRCVQAIEKDKEEGIEESNKNNTNNISNSNIKFYDINKYSTSIRQATNISIYQRKP
jgi:LPXTG-site transpeptidase (sortase) family protein